jgi:hypothetical protein
MRWQSEDKVLLHALMTTVLNGISGLIYIPAISLHVESFRLE